MQYKVISICLFLLSNYFGSKVRYQEMHDATNVVFEINHEQEPPKLHTQMIQVIPFLEHSIPKKTANLSIELRQKKKNNYN